jgi:hypothetical protein
LDEKEIGSGDWTCEELETKQLMRKCESEGRSERKGGLTRNVQRSLMKRTERKKI